MPKQFLEDIERALGPLLRAAPPLSELVTEPKIAEIHRRLSAIRADVNNLRHKLRPSKSGADRLH